MDKLDILSREEFVERLVKLTENISANKSTTSFAINGSWGCGKSFVLDMFEEELSKYQSEETAMDKYFIIRYNCWKYDYYEEPLIAIVATIIDVIEEKTKLFPDTQDNREMLGMLKAAGNSFAAMLNTIVKNKTGIDIKEAYDTVRQGAKEGIVEYEKDHSFDVYFSFKIVMNKLHELLNDLAKEFTIVLLVDELDRCLPEYAIKVLERLHHLSEGTTNIITIISMDKKQLEASIQQIFGFGNPEKYLEKFINFEVALDYGTVSEKITEKYANYVSLFDADLFTFPESIEEFMRDLFADVDIRTQEQIFKRAMLTHRLLFSDKKDYSFMCMELLLAVSICLHGDESFFEDRPIANVSFDTIFSASRNGPHPKYVQKFAERIKALGMYGNRSFQDEPLHYTLPHNPNLYAAILFLWYWTHVPHKGIAIRYRQGDVYETIAHNSEELKKFVATIHMIK